MVVPHDCASSVVTHWMASGHVIVFVPADLKVQLQATDYGSFLQNEASPLTVSVIDERLREKLVTEFHYMRNHCYPPLNTFLDYIT